jgi:acylphosphatase
MPTVHLIIKGRVQGVFFRATAKNIASEIGVVGWVKNTEEGQVEMMVSGSGDQLKNFIAWCKVGPQKAIVTDVIVTNTEEKSFKNFEVVRKQK